LIAVTTDLEGLHVGEGWTLVEAHQIVLTGCGDEERSARLEGATAIRYKARDEKIDDDVDGAMLA